MKRACEYPRTVCAFGLPPKAQLVQLAKDAMAEEIDEITVRVHDYDGKLIRTIAVSDPTAYRLETLIRSVLWQAKPLEGFGVGNSKRRTPPNNRPFRIFDEACDFFGCTESFLDAGYILPDGRMLNFKRSNNAMHHRNISRMGHGVNPAVFMLAGAIQVRFDFVGSTGSERQITIRTIRRLTEQQARRIAEVMRDVDSIAVDIEDVAATGSFMQIPRVSAVFHYQRSLSEILKFIAGNVPIDHII